MKRASSQAPTVDGGPLRLQRGVWWPFRVGAVVALAVFVPVQQLFGHGAWMSALGGLAVFLLLTYRRWLELDARRRVARLSWGFVVPLLRDERRILRASLVSVKRAPQLTPAARRRGERATIETFPVTLHFGEGDDLLIAADTDAFAARRLARRVARDFGVGLLDEIDEVDAIHDFARQLPAEQVSKRLLERLRDAPPSPPSEPAQCRVRASRSPQGELLIETPARGFNVWDLPALVLFDCVAVLEIPVVVGYLESDSAGTRELLVLAGAAIAAFLLVFAGAQLRRWTTRLTFTAGEAGLRVVRRDLFFSATQQVAAGQLEELAVRVSHGERTPALVLETDAQHLLLGEGFSAEELTWIRALLLEELLFGKGAAQDAGTESESAG